MKDPNKNIFKRIKWFFYDVKVAVFKNNGNARKKTGVLNAKVKEKAFLFFFLLFPVVQFLIFYVALNFNSFLLAFNKFDMSGKKTFTGLENFKEVLCLIFVKDFKGEFLQHFEMVRMIKNSAIQTAFSLFLMLPVNVISAYVVFKKVPFSDAIKVLLFLPNLIPSMVFVISAKALIMKGLPIIFEGADLLNTAKTSSFWTILVFGLWMSFAGGMVVYLSAMSGVPKEILEYGQLEPMSSYTELVKVIVPLIYPTIVTYVVVGVANFFIAQGYYFSFFGGSIFAKLYDNLGYYFFVQVAANDEFIGKTRFGFAAAGGILFTIVVAPVTFMVKHLMEKYGPSED